MCGVAHTLLPLLADSCLLQLLGTGREVGAPVDGGVHVKGRHIRATHICCICCVLDMHLRKQAGTEYGEWGGTL